MKLFTVLLLLILSAPACALEAVLKWTAPTTRTDGKPLKLEEIDVYWLRYQLKPDSLKWVVFERALPATTTSFTHTLPFADEYCFQVKVVDKQGTPSAWSEVKCKVYADIPAPPSAPVLLDLQG